MKKLQPPKDGKIQVKVDRELTRRAMDANPGRWATVAEMFRHLAADAARGAST